MTNLPPQKTYSVVEFIEQILLPDLDKMVAAHLHYYAFAIICQGVELMGASRDEQPLQKDGLSQTRFKNGLTRYFSDQRYTNNHTKFFELLRGPLIHQLRPSEVFFLSCSAKDNIPPDRHLTKQDGVGATILIIEPFLADFQKAFRRFKKELAASKVAKSERFSGGFLTVFQIAETYQSPKWNPGMGQLAAYSVSGRAFEPFVISTRANPDSVS